jgi:hypothetical protein
MFIENERLVTGLKEALTDYANHIDFFVQRIASNENIKIFNSYQNSSDSESICVQAMIYKTHQDYGEMLTEFSGEIPDAPQLLNSNALIKNINKKGIKRFIKQNNLDLPFFALLSKANPDIPPEINFTNNKLTINIVRKSGIESIKSYIKYDKCILESIEKGTWKIIRDKVNALDNLKF